MFLISELRCEFASNPLGIDVRQPRFSWKLYHPQRGQAQTAYQVLVASSLERLDADVGDLWDSGKQPTLASPLVEYAGARLVSRQRAYWKVRAWDAQDVPSAYSEPAWFEMGLLEADDWAAEWIGFPSGWNGRALYFRHGFEVEQAVAKARLYICGLGWYEPHLNGHKVGDRVLDPAQTDYGKRVLYTTYDVTALLRPGLNVIGAVVGNGWYGTPKLLAQVELTYTDGTTARVITGKWNAGGSWWRVSDGAIIENGIYDGETYDARLERPGWDTPETYTEALPNRGDWAGTMATEPPGGRLAAQMIEPVQVIESRWAVTLSQPKPGVYVYDVGQNLAGWARLTVQGERGTTVQLRFAESLYDDGTANQENLRAARSRDVYILKGEGIEIWEPRFTYHGFRYVQMEGFPGEPTLDALEIRVVRSNMQPSGEFECDHPLINQIHRAVWWTEASNWHGVPTDCPQRDERMGWLNDMAARCEEALYNFNLARLLPKWLNDIADTQNEAGAIADTAPFRWGSRPGDPVVVCYLLIPWLLYCHYGDQRVLGDHYAGMKRWVDYLTTRADDHILRDSHIGDWAPPITEGVLGSIGSSALARNTPGALVSTAYYAYAAALLARIARVLGRAEDAAAYAALFEQIRAAFNQHFWDETAGGYGTNNQACNTLALYMDLTPADRRARVVANLVRDVEARDRHLTTGNLTTKYILEVLTDAGHGDLAFALATQTTYPSWGYMLAQGATTIWERWELTTGRGMNSHNHPMYAAIGAWFYRALAGIRLDEDGSAFGNFTIQPLFPNGITRASAALKTLRGTLSCGWQRSRDELQMQLHIPVGGRAKVTLPKPARAARLRLLEGGVVVWQTGAIVGEMPGILALEEAEHALTIVLGSGAYDLRLSAAP